LHHVSIRVVLFHGWFLDRPAVSDVLHFADRLVLSKDAILQSSPRLREHTTSFLSGHMKPPFRRRHAFYREEPITDSAGIRVPLGNRPSIAQAQPT
jgi:hypothetical protein